MGRTPRRSIICLVACLVAASPSRGDEPSGRRVLGWGDVVDPSRDCKVTHDPDRDRLTVMVPGTPHVLSAEVPNMAMSAPRVLQTAYGDFKASVKVGGRLNPGKVKNTPYDPYHGAGLIVWKDGRNYLRLERAAAYINGRETNYINYELREDGRLTTSHGFTTHGRPLYLKIERSGGVILAWQSEDGRRWSALPGISVPFRGKVEMGVLAVSASRRPLRAELEGFKFEVTDEVAPPSESTPKSTSKPAEGAGEKTELK
jgi:regulation of enolase protein 1 (concanavalin A-like superfamily)